jgi:DNA-binding LacI/PurR family transcriptional regulator
MAIGALQEATALGLRVPDDLSIVGFDGIEAGTWTQPTLTTVEQPIDEIADTAVSALQTLIDEPDQAVPSFAFRPQLRIGGTTAAR